MPAMSCSAKWDARFRFLARHGGSIKFLRPPQPEDGDCVVVIRAAIKRGRKKYRMDSTVFEKHIREHDGFLVAAVRDTVNKLEREVGS